MGAEKAPAGSHKQPPPLPPRQGHSNMSALSNDDLPTYESLEMASSKTDTEWAHRDPRSSSQQSLVPESEQNERRKLLLIYVHGFMGNETSFRSFPAHVHNLLSVLMSESHVVHTKLYPRYRSKRNISFARDDFSKWLAPHEDASTDVVLLGHSMGGLLAAEVVLQPPLPSTNRPLRHRILGTINFDVPFLGMHPGVVKSGLASIFTSGEAPGDKWSMESQTEVVHGGEGGSVDASTASPPSHADPLWSHEDPHFNPTFANDVVLPVRKGWRSALHFVTKHSDNLSKATKQLVSSHMEFGGAMANYGELKTRYARIRALEEVDENIRKSVLHGQGAPSRVRFVNYYTASTGRPKKGRSPQAEKRKQGSQSMSGPGSVLSPGGDDRESGAEAGANKQLNPTSDMISGTTPEAWQDAMATLTIVGSEKAGGKTENETLKDQGTDLPGLPVLPPKPGPLDTSFILDESTRKLVEKEHTNAINDYEKALEERAKLIGQRSSQVKKSVQKPEPDSIVSNRPATLRPESEMTHSEREALRLEKERQRMETEARRLRGEQEPQDNEEATSSAFQGKLSDDGTAKTSKTESQDIPSSYTTKSTAASEREEHGERKPSNDRKFCTLPPKDSNGERDPCWVRIYMEGVDEVGAHCGLFFVDERYERLVGEVSERIESWVHDV